MIAILSEIHPYIDFIHLREKTWSDRDMAATVNKLLSQGMPRQKIIVNYRINLAHTMETGGVQLPFESIGFLKLIESYKKLRIGCSVHSIKEAIEAEKLSVDYLVYGHIFESDSKKGVAPRGVTNLQEVTQHTSIPVIAIGGITPENTQNVLKIGASGIAVLSGVLLADDPLQAVRRYREQMKGASW